MYSPDLATECQVAAGAAVHSIGWLERGHDFRRARALPAFVAQLRSHVTDGGRWLPVVSAGIHTCDLGGCERASGAQHVIIPSHTCVYVAPELVLHYVEQHDYAAPQEFVDAVIACPEQSSDGYVELLAPFGTIWRLNAQGVARVAKAARMRREEAAHLAAQLEANKGSFKW